MLARIVRFMADLQATRHIVLSCDLWTEC